MHAPLVNDRLARRNAVLLAVAQALAGANSTVVFATGYHEADPYAVLGDAAVLCHADEQGRPQVGRDYRVSTDPELSAGVYLQGGTEHTHGITSALLSNTAVRVGEILDSVVARRSAGSLVGA